MVETKQQDNNLTDIVEGSDITELEEIYSKLSGTPAPKPTSAPNPIPEKKTSISTPITKPVAAPSPIIIQPSPVIQKTANVIDPPKSIQQTPQQTSPTFQPFPPPPPSEPSKVAMNLDDFIERIAEEKKQQFKQLTYTRLLASISGESVVEQSALPEQPKTETVVVKDNSEAIHLLDMAMLNPDVQDLAALQNMKRKLQGLPPIEQTSSEANAYKKAAAAKDPKPKKDYGLKFALVVFSITVVAALGIGLVVLHFI